jgi:hypothetical protein
MRVHFSTDDLPPRDREESWLDFVSKNVISVTPGERPDPATFRAHLDAVTAGRFTMFDLHTSHRINGRTGADVSRDNLDKFNLRRVSAEQVYRVLPVRRRLSGCSPPLSVSHARQIRPSASDRERLMTRIRSRSTGEAW